MIGKRCPVSAYLTFWILLFYLSAHSFPLFAQSLPQSNTNPGSSASLTAPSSDPSSDLASFESSLMQSFIEIQTSSTEGDHFYEVLIDEEERPYLDITDAVSKHLKLEAACKPEVYYCEVQKALRELYHQWRD